MNTNETAAEELPDNVIPFAQPQVKPAGKGPTDEGNWLSRLPHGTRFLSRPKNSLQSALGEFIVASPVQGKGWMLLGIVDYAKEHLTLSKQDTINFSKTMELYDILPNEPAEEQEEQENPDG